MRTSRAKQFMVSFISALISIATPSLAASFDCNKARTVVDGLICNDSTLSAQDSALGEVYGKLRALTVDRVGLEKDERAWLRSVRDHCNTVICLLGAYTEREITLNSLLKDAQQASGESPTCGVNTQEITKLKCADGTEIGGNDSFNCAENADHSIFLAAIDHCVEDIKTPVSIYLYHDKYSKPVLLGKLEEKVISIAWGALAGR